MGKNLKTIISASRRTDIPAFHYDWLQKALKNEIVTISNPMYKGSKTNISLRPEEVHSIVLWSKNIKNVLENPMYLENYNLFFQFTITNYSKFLEPNVPEYKETLKVLEGLLKKYRPEQFNIRFDPIIISTKGEINPTPKKPGLARLIAFENLCKNLKAIGMDNCRLTTSYISMYGKVERNIKASGLDIINLSEDVQVEFMKRMVDIANKYNRDIYSCSCPILEKVPEVKKSSCIDGDLLEKLFNEKCTHAKDSGQRLECGCAKSKDIGSYGLPCRHGCRYCYA